MGFDSLLRTCAVPGTHKTAMAELNTDKPPIIRIMASVTSTNQAEIYAELQPEAQRQLSTIQTLNRWRKRVGILEGVEYLVFSGSFETGGGFVLELGAKDPSLLKDAVVRFEHDLGAINGIYDIRDDFETGKPRMRLLLKPEARARHLGLSPSDLASQIGNAFGGLDVQRIQRGTEEVKVVVKSRKDRRKYIQGLIKLLEFSRKGCYNYQVFWRP